MQGEDDPPPSDSVKNRLLAQMKARLDARRKREVFEEEGATAAEKLARWDEPGGREGLRGREDAERHRDRETTGGRREVLWAREGWREGREREDTDEEEDEGDDMDEGPEGEVYCRWRTADKVR